MPGSSGGYDRDSEVQAVAEPVRVAYAEVFPPFTELRDGKAEGPAVDILRAAWSAPLEPDGITRRF